jgi:hypothetical protein
MICVSITIIPIIHIGKAVYGWPQKMNGFESCRENNKIADTRVCFLTAGELYYGDNSDIAFILGQFCKK